MMTDEARTWDRYLDDALLAHLGTVTLSTARATGALRTRGAAPSQDQQICQSFRPGRFGEGRTASR